MFKLFIILFMLWVVSISFFFWWNKVLGEFYIYFLYVGKLLILGGVGVLFYKGVVGFSIIVLQVVFVEFLMFLFVLWYKD